jgi:chemotaxis signal transduction protein
MVHKDAKSSRKSRTGRQQAMITPTAALQYLAARKRKLELYVEEKKADARYGFRIGELKLLLRPHEKVEVIEAVMACPIPNTPAWFAGMVNLRGNLLPVFDIKQLLNMQNLEPPKWIMVFGQGNHAAGIFADNLPSGVIPDSTAEIKPDLPEILQDCVENTLMQGDSMWIEVAFEKMFEDLRSRF